MSQLWRGSLASGQSEIVKTGRWRSRREVSSPQGPKVSISGRNLDNFCSNDYLGLACHPVLIKASSKATQDWGVGSGASHLVCGHQALHSELEQSLAEFVGAERAILFSNGYMANLALATSFASKGDLILQDKLNHASLIDGARLSAAEFKRYRHSDVEHASLLLDRHACNKSLIMTDGVFSMDGDQAPLSELAQLANKREALLVVDDAHGFACLGDTGKGALEQAHLAPAGNVVLMATLGKGLGSYGAFVAGDAPFIERLIQTARSYIYTTALPPSVVAASLASIELVTNDGQALRSTLRGRINQFKSGLKGSSIKLLPSDSAIQPIVVGDELSSLNMSRRLEKKGFLVSAIRPPTVPEGTARLRVTLSAAHTSEQIECLLAALMEVSNG